MSDARTQTSQQISKRQKLTIFIGSQRVYRAVVIYREGKKHEMVSLSASVNFPLHHKVQKFSSDTGSPGWSRKKGRKMVVCACVINVKKVYK